MNEKFIVFTNLQNFLERLYSYTEYFVYIIASQYINYNI